MRENKSTAEAQRTRRKTTFVVLCALCVSAVLLVAAQRTPNRVALAGLQKPVEVIRDKWGVPHIYAETTHDLFFAQGYVVVQDRLWQIEMWRRRGEGRLAEIAGERALESDIQARRVKYRGDMAAEWASYAPDARQIITSFVAGVNAYISHATAANKLPVEFEMMGFKPEPWTPEVCLTRVAGYIMTRSLPTEVLLGELMNKLGPEKAIDLIQPDPNTKIRAEPGLDMRLLAGRAPQLLAGHRAVSGAVFERMADIGSNNWTVSGKLTRSGRPIVANDPHRALSVPSLRYIAHLVGPGWNVIGAGEPSLPGLAIAHNERVGYGVTIFAADLEDIFVERTDPANPRRYEYRGGWEMMRVERERFRVKGKPEPVEVELRFTRHGPVIHQDEKDRVAFALRWSGSEPGGAGYLASLSLNRAKNWNEFVTALDRWKTPPLNFVYADVDGNIGYQVAGLMPVRKNWNGLVPVPGQTGRYEWRGWRPLKELPRAFNPERGFVATANHKTFGAKPSPPPAYEWTPPFRYGRLEQALSARRDFTIADMQRLQHDETSLPAQRLLEMAKELNLDDVRLRDALAMLRSWDYVLSVNSPAATLYEFWMLKLGPKVMQPLVPRELWSLYSSRSNPRIIFHFLERTDRDRNALLLESLREAVTDLTGRLGSDMRSWRWGDLHKAEFRHPLSDKFNLAPVRRGGDGYTVNNTAYSATTFRQSSGASYRHIFDVGDWDNSVAINVPGQSGVPGSPHYSDLLPLWAAGQYHPLPYSRKAVEQHASERFVLQPATR